MTITFAAPGTSMHELLYGTAPEQEQEVVRNGTTVRITNSDYDSVPDGALGTIKTKYHEARGGVYGIALTEATSAFGQGSTIAFYRNQFEVVTRTETTVEDLAVGDEVRMVFPEGGSAYRDVFGQVGTVTELPGGFMQGLVDVNFGGRSVICYAYRLELVEKFVPPIPGEPVEDLSTLRAGDVVNVSWDGERIQGELFESTGAFGGPTLRVRAGSEPNVVWLEGSELAFGIRDVRLVERNDIAHEQAERVRLRAASPTLANGDRVTITATPVSVDDPFVPNSELEVGDVGTIVDADLDDGDYEVDFGGEKGWQYVAGACLERVAPLGRDLKVGDVVESAEQLADMALCAVVKNPSGAVFVRNSTPSSPTVHEDWIAWTGLTMTSQRTFDSMGQLTVIDTGLNA